MRGASPTNDVMRGSVFEAVKPAASLIAQKERA